MNTHVLSGEASNTLVAAIFSDRESAARAAGKLASALHLAAWQVSVVHPGDSAFSRKLEPERTGIWRTLLRSHIVLGLAGMVFGALIGAVMILGNLMSAERSPGAVMAAAIGFSTMAGLMLGGLVSLRPDHTRVIERVRDGLAQGRWAVVAHPTNSDQTHAAIDALEREGGEVVRSF